MVEGRYGIGQGCSDKEILLLQSETLAVCIGILGIKDRADGIRSHLSLYRTAIV